MACGNCKGTVLTNLREYVIKGQGEARWKELVASLPPADRDVLDGMVLVGGWYPVGIWNRLLRNYLGNLSDANSKMLEIARFISDRDLNTLFKALLRVGSPGFVLARTDSLWNRYFDTGKFSSREVEPRRWHLTINAPTGDDEAAGEWTCNPGVCGWLEHALSLTGAKQAKVSQTKCRFHGSALCEYLVHW